MHLMNLLSVVAFLCLSFVLGLCFMDLPMGLNKFDGDDNLPTSDELKLQSNLSIGIHNRSSSA